MPGIIFPTSDIEDYDAKQYHLSRTGGKLAVYEICHGNNQWTNEIVALETEFMIQTDTKYTDLDKSRLLRNFMKFVLRVSAHAIWLIVSIQFPQSYLQKFHGLYSLCCHWEEGFERFSTIPGVCSWLAPKLSAHVGRHPIRFDATSSVMEDPSSGRPRSFHVYPRQWFCCPMSY